MLGEPRWRDAVRFVMRWLFVGGLGVGAAVAGLGVYEWGMATHDRAVAKLAIGESLIVLDSLRAQVAERGCVWVDKRGGR